MKKSLISLSLLVICRVFTGCSLDPAPAVVSPAGNEIVCGSLSTVTVPSTVFDVKDYGAKGNGSANDTAAIQAAVNACFAAGGGTVRLHDGSFFAGTIRLKSGMIFRIEGTATLLGSPYFNDYPDLIPPTTNPQTNNCKRALLYAESVHDLVIEGGGTIDGRNGSYDNSGGKENRRPMAVFNACSTNIIMRNVKINNSCMWSCVSMECVQLDLSNLTVQSSGITRDGIDLVDCQHAVVEFCSVNSGDDGICLKTAMPVGLDDVLVKNCTVQSYCNALKFGTPTYGPVRNVVFQDIAVVNTRLSGIALEAIDGSDETNITFQRISMNGVGNAFFVLLGNRGSTPAGYPAKIGSVNGVKFLNITVTNVNAAWGCPITGTIINGVTYRLRNLLFSNVRVTYAGGQTSVPVDPPEYAGQYPECDMWGDLPSCGYYFRHADGITMIGCQTLVFPSDIRNWYAANDASNLDIRGLVTTTIRVHKDAGYGNSISIRGDTTPLVWSNGRGMTWTSGNVWVWTTTQFANGQGFQFKVLKNDSVWESGGNHSGTGGQTIDITPSGF